MKGMYKHMLLNEYIEQVRTIIKDAFTMYEEMKKTAEKIDIDYVADEDSLESDIELTSGDSDRLLSSIGKSEENLRELLTGLKQLEERYNTVTSVINRRKARLKSLDISIYATKGEVVGSAEEHDELRLRNEFSALIADLSDEDAKKFIEQIKKIRGIK